MVKPCAAIRLARACDFPLLQAVEADAAQRFEAFGLGVLAGMQGRGAAFYTSLDPAHNIVLIAPDADDRPVGFAIGQTVDGTGYLGEVSVAMAWAGRGLGRALIRGIMDWAQGQAYPSLTLTSFKHLPFNGPYYEKMGFQALPPALPGRPELAAIRAHEAALDAWAPRGAWIYVWPR